MVRQVLFEFKKGSRQSIEIRSLHPMFHALGVGGRGNKMRGGEGGGRRGDRQNDGGKGVATDDGRSQLMMGYGVTTADGGIGG